jgi:hypothetical protein
VIVVSYRVDGFLKFGLFFLFGAAMSTIRFMTPI